MVQRKDDIPVDRASLNQSQVYLLSQRHFPCKIIIPFRSITRVLVSVLRERNCPNWSCPFTKKKAILPFLQQWIAGVTPAPCESAEGYVGTGSKGCGSAAAAATPHCDLWHGSCFILKVVSPRYLTRAHFSMGFHLGDTFIPSAPICNSVGPCKFWYPPPARTQTMARALQVLCFWAWPCASAKQECLKHNLTTC